MSTTMMMTNILPHDVVIDILSRLPVKSVLRFRCVSKPWKIFFSDPSFINMHLKHSINNNNYEHLMLENSCLYSIAANNSNESSLADEAVKIDDYPFKPLDDSEVKILGSCNGLLLIHSEIWENYYIWNPSTKEFKKLPFTFSKERFAVYGFGYDEITEDYKVVRITSLFKRHHFVVEYDESVGHSEVEVYSLRSNSWRKSQDIPYKLGVFDGRLVNGALHWKAENNNNILSNSEENDPPYAIVSFNVGDEKFRVIEQPNYADNEFNMDLNVLGGCLCIFCNFFEIGSEIWVMKDYGVKESWTKLFNISQPTVNTKSFYYKRPIKSFYYKRPIKFNKNGVVVFQKDYNSLFVYDPKHGTAKTLQIRGFKGEFQTYTSYVESLISLNSGTFVGQEQATLEETLALEKTLRHRRETGVNRR